MLKKNEQGAWQRRYCCLVPHTFLYYFESKDAEVGVFFFFFNYLLKKKHGRNEGTRGHLSLLGNVLVIA